MEAIFSRMSCVNSLGSVQNRCRAFSGKYWQARSRERLRHGDDAETERVCQGAAQARHVGDIELLDIHGLVMVPGDNAQLIRQTPP